MELSENKRSRRRYHNIKSMILRAAKKNKSMIITHSPEAWVVKRLTKEGFIVIKELGLSGFIRISWGGKKGGKQKQSERKWV